MYNHKARIPTMARGRIGTGRVNGSASEKKRVVKWGECDGFVKIYTFSKTFFSFLLSSPFSAKAKIKQYP